MRTVERLHCPTELYVDLGPALGVPVGAEISGNEAGMAFVNLQFRRGDRAEAVIADARAACDAAGALTPSP